MFEVILLNASTKAINPDAKPPIYEIRDKMF